MPEIKTKRRGQGEDSIFFVAERNRYIGDISVGFRADGRRIRRRVSGRTKQEVRDKLKALHDELDAGLKAPRTYTVRQARSSPQSVDTLVLNCSWLSRV